MKRAIPIPALILIAALAFAFSDTSNGEFRQVPSSDVFRVAQIPPSGSLARKTAAREPDYGNVPLYFIPNRGQVDEQAFFYAKTSRYTLWMTREGLVFDAAISEREKDDVEWGKKMATADPESLLRESVEQENKLNFKRDVSRVIFLGANTHPRLTAVEPIENQVSYFIGNDPSKWRTGIPSSRAVLYDDLYPGIDLKVYGVESRVEYDWIVKPGARVEDIRFEYRDAASTSIDSNGDLIVETQLGRITHHRPLSYQSIGGKKVEVSSAFADVGKNAYGFTVDSYDRGQDLIIDPILVYSTYLGGSGDDFATDIAVDRTGAAYIVGYTSSTNFPLRGSLQSTNKGQTDIFVTKFAPSGKALVYSTFLGGSSIDEAYGIAIDSSGAAYVTGETWSSDFPVQNAFQSDFVGGCTDVFVTKLSPLGNSLEYSTFIHGDGPGNGWDRGRAIAVDYSGAAYVTGWTSSSNFPLLNPFQSTGSHEKWNGFVTKFTPAGNALVFSTYLGGSLQDGCWGIAVDNAGSAYVTGWTNSSDFPLQNPCQAKMGGEVDAFVTKFSPAGNVLVYSTYLGGQWMEWPHNITVDGLGAAYVIGETFSEDFPVKNAFQKSWGGNVDLFITKLIPSGKALAFSTYLGGSFWEQAGDIAVDKSGAVYVTGETGSPDFPFQNPFQKTLVNGDVFVTKFAASGKALDYSTCLGGNERERGLGIALDGKGAAYVAGWTNSSNLPLQNPYQKTNRGSWDSFVAKLNFSLAAITMTAPDGGETWKVGSTNTVSWDFTGKTGASVKLELLKGTKINALIAAGAAVGTNGKGSFRWKVPSGQAEGGDYRIRIASNKYKSLTDTSNAAFTISK